MTAQTSEGYLSELFSSIQGEGGTVRGSCFGKRQIFIRFAGCNLANRAFNSSGCFWCDTPNAQSLTPKNFKYEDAPGSQMLKNRTNPVNPSQVIQIINDLITPDLHSISITGGEPLHQLNFLIQFAKAIKDADINYPLYLETNGSIRPNSDQIEEISQLFDYCCCDIKDRFSKAADIDQWKNLIDIELGFIEILAKKGLDVFAKIIVTNETEIGDLKYISKTLSEIKFNDGKSVGLAIQPAFFAITELIAKYNTSNDHLNNLFYAAAKYLKPESLSLSIQAHKFLNLL